MNIELWTIGKESNKHLESATNLYINRLNHYTRFQLLTIDNSKINKNLPLPQLLEKEALLVLQKLNDKDTLVCLDDKGKAFSSVQFSEKLNQLLSHSTTKIVFLIGGSYGISETLKKKSNFIFSLSSLTFPHQLVRLIFCEQLYRAFSILKNEKYHHE
ncbi:MAG TPA: 23S rRNA (pseudouridine(1915)-N(3))-methyltransferase RlmH [Chitinophagaceae bacterium]|nr:23S rRNA (pseudouridine(1915)-N(3))-methyltransferase RlmH [Chitinophagaceae bacterium]